jgi:hypothetical protein
MESFGSVLEIRLQTNITISYQVLSTKYSVIHLLGYEYNLIFETNRGTSGVVKLVKLHSIVWILQWRECRMCIFSSHLSDRNLTHLTRKNEEILIIL